MTRQIVSIQISTKTFDIIIKELKTIDDRLYEISNFNEQLKINDNIGLATPSLELCKKLEKFSTKHHVDEKYWVNAFRNIYPITLPYLNNNRSLFNKEEIKEYCVKKSLSPAQVRQTLGISTFKFKNIEHILLAVVLTYIHRLNNYDVFSINFSNSEIRKSITELKLFYASHVPLTVDTKEAEMSFIEFINKIKKLIENLSKHTSYKLDVFQRYPSIHKTFMPLAICLHSRFEELKDVQTMALLTMHICESTIYFKFNQAKLPNLNFDEIANNMFNHMTTITNGWS